MGRSFVGGSVRFYSRMVDWCCDPAGGNSLRGSNGEIEELGAGAIFPARVESHCHDDSLRNESEVSCRLPLARAVMAAIVIEKIQDPTLRKSCEREVGSPCR